MPPRPDGSAALPGGRADGADLVVRTGVERSEGGQPGLRQGQQAEPSIGRGRGAADQPAALKAAQNSAQVTGVQAQFLGQPGGRQPLRAGDLIEHAGLGQRKRAAQQPLFEHPDLLGVKAVEPAQRVNPPIKSRIRHLDRPINVRKSAIVNESIDEVNRLRRCQRKFEFLPPPLAPLSERGQKSAGPESSHPSAKSRAPKSTHCRPSFLLMATTAHAPFETFAPARVNCCVGWKCAQPSPICGATTW